MSVRVLYGPVIHAGQSLSEPFDCTAGRVIRIHTPESWSPAPLSFQISVDNITWYDLFDANGREVTVQSIVPNSAVLVQTHQVREVWVKFRSGWRANPHPQHTDCTFMVVLDVATPGNKPIQAEEE